MTSSKAELASLYRDCYGCGESMCTETDGAYYDSPRRDWYCDEACYELAKIEHEHMQATYDSLRAGRI